MIKSESLVFLQLQKTGGTYAEDLLRTILGAKAGAKHRPLPRDWDRDGRLVLGGVRNPWDWYVSFFTYGCERRGGLSSTYPLAAPFGAVRRRQARGRLPLVPSAALARGAASAIVHEARHRPDAWADLLEDSGDIAAFRAFVRRLLAPQYRFAAAMDYGFSPFAGRIGLFSYLYLLLYLRDRRALFARGGPVARALEAPETLDAALIVDRFVPMERLEPALSEGVAAAGQPEAAAEIAARAGRGRINASSRQRDYRPYYDDATRDLVADRERLIVGRHGYVF